MLSFHIQTMHCGGICFVFGLHSVIISDKSGRIGSWGFKCFWDNSINSESVDFRGFETDII